jgi:hypothetical protein
MISALDHIPDLLAPVKRREPMGAIVRNARHLAICPSEEDYWLIDYSPTEQGSMRDFIAPTHGIPAILQDLHNCPLQEN